MPRKRVDDPVRRALGKRIALYRVRAGLTQESLAHLCGMAGITISLIERGMRSPDYTGLKRIAKALDTVPSRLVMAIDEIELPPLPRIESEDLPPRRRKWK